VRGLIRAAAPVTDLARLILMASAGVPAADANTARGSAERASSAAREIEGLIGRFRY
jgi:hypothetical protein